MKICGVCNQVFTRGGTGPKKMPLCSAHFHRYRRGSKSWKDPSIRGDGVDLARVRISQSARDELESMFTDAKKKRPALTFHEFFDLLVTYLPMVERLPGDVVLSREDVKWLLSKALVTDFESADDRSRTLAILRGRR